MSQPSERMRRAEWLPPWRSPSRYRCERCGGPAGAWACRELVCDACFRPVMDESLDRWGKAAGREIVRQSWGYWLRGLFWRTYHHLSPRSRRTTRATKRPVGDLGL